MFHELPLPVLQSCHLGLKFEDFAVFVGGVLTAPSVTQMLFSRCQVSCFQRGFESFNFWVQLTQDVSKNVSLLFVFLIMSLVFFGAGLGIRYNCCCSHYGRLKLMLMSIMWVTIDVNFGLQVIQLYGLKRALYGLSVRIFSSSALKRGPRAPRKASWVFPDAETFLGSAFEIATTRATLII